MSTRQSPLEGIIDAASKFEESHYKDTDASGSAEPLTKTDFSSASKSIGNTISDSATAVKEAIVGKDDRKDSAASSPAESSRGVVAQMMAAGLAMKEAVIPTAYADERSSGDELLRGGVGEGQSMGHIQQLGQTAEAVMEYAVTNNPHPQGPGSKWADAKEETRESGRQANAAAKDAMGAVGDTVDRWGNKVSHEADKASDKADKWTQDRKEDVERAGDRTQDAFYNMDANVRGVATEASNLTGRAADRVQGDWRELKQGTENLANNSTTARLNREAREAEEKAKENAGGIFGWIKNLGGSAGDKADDAAKRAKASGRSAAEDVKDSANSAYRTAQDKAHEGKQEAKGWFNAARDDVDDAATRAKRTGNRAADNINEKAESSKETARGWFGGNSIDDASRRGHRAADRASDKGGNYVDAAGNKISNLKHRAGDKINRFGNRVSDAADDAEQWTKDTIHEVGDYMTADLGPHSSSEAAVQRGYIPSNTADVMVMLSHRYQ